MISPSNRTWAPQPPIGSTSARTPSPPSSYRRRSPRFRAAPSSSSSPRTPTAPRLADARTACMAPEHSARAAAESLLGILKMAAAARTPRSIRGRGFRRACDWSFISLPRHCSTCTPALLSPPLADLVESPSPLWRALFHHPSRTAVLRQASQVARIRRGKVQ